MEMPPSISTSAPASDAPPQSTTQDQPDSLDGQTAAQSTVGRLRNHERQTLSQHFKCGMLTGQARRYIDFTVYILGWNYTEEQRVKDWIEQEKSRISSRNQLAEVSALADALKWAVRHPNPDPEKPGSSYHWPEDVDLDPSSWDNQPEEGHPNIGLEDSQAQAERTAYLANALGQSRHAEDEHQLAGLLEAVTTASDDTNSAIDLEVNGYGATGPNRSKRRGRVLPASTQEKPVESNKRKRPLVPPADHLPRATKRKRDNLGTSGSNHEGSLSSTLEIRSLPPPHASLDAKAAGVHSAAALFRTPPSTTASGKKSTRPPMSRLFESLELSPEDFLRLQAAAKTYMLDPAYPERRDCVGNRGSAHMEMVKLRLYNCVKDFLDREGYGLRYFGEGRGPSARLRWPDQEQSVIAAVTPLLRRMVTNERQRQYAIESRSKSGSSAPSGQPPLDGPDSEVNDHGHDAGNLHPSFSSSLTIAPTAGEQGRKRQPRLEPQTVTPPEEMSRQAQAASSSSPSPSNHVDPVTSKQMTVSEATQVPDPAKVVESDLSTTHAITTSSPSSSITLLITHTTAGSNPRILTRRLDIPLPPPPTTTTIDPDSATHAFDALQEAAAELLLADAGDATVGGRTRAARPRAGLVPHALLPSKGLTAVGGADTLREVMEEVRGAGWMEGEVRVVLLKEGGGL